MSRDPMLISGADDPRFVWIGYPDVAAPDRFAIVDDEAEKIFLYVPLDVACRWQAEQRRRAAAGERTDARDLELRFHATPADDVRLARLRDKYLQRAAHALDHWDHAPRGDKARAAK